MEPKEPFEIKVDSLFIRTQIQKKIDETIQESGVAKIFYSLEDLTKITSFSTGHIRNTFFNDSRFQLIRHRVGKKWVFPVKETNDFLLKWLSEQPHE